MRAALALPTIAFALLASSAARAATNTSTHTATATSAHYPSKDASLALLSVETPRGFKKKRIYLDPGHGVAGNEGATTALCEREEDAVLRIARAVADHLTASGRFVVQLARKDSKGPSYDRRLDAAASFRADAIVSIHLDARGDSELVAPPASPELSCPRNDHEVGFGVLVSDRNAADDLVAKRKKLARSVAKRLAEIGLPAYDGFDYGKRYQLDGTPGVFIDRRGLFLLRRPAIPSVIVETHHGWHLAEAERWHEPETLAAFAAALDAGLTDALRD